MTVVKPQIRPVWAQSAAPTEIIDPGNDIVAAGFPRSTVPPVRQFLNWILNYCTNSVRYLCRRGVADYDPSETYARHDIVRGDDNCLYRSLKDANIGNLPSKSPAFWGNVEIYCRTAAEVAADVLPVNFEYPELNVLRYGADNTGRVPCDIAIANAVSVACPGVGSGGSARRVYLPSGQYLVTSTIDLTNSRKDGTRVKDGLAFQGESIGATRIIGKTGANKPVIETTGAQWLSIEDLTITGAPSGYSTVGIFQGLSSSLAETQNQKFSRVLISMADDPGANGGAGTVGIWNFGAEENTYDTLWIKANLPLMFTAHNPSPNTGFKTPVSYQILGRSHSLGMSTFAGECCFVALNKRQPSIITEDVNSMKFVNAYLSNIGGGGVNESAWTVYGSLDGVEYAGLVESHGRFWEVFGAVSSARVRVTFGGIDKASTERLLLRRGAQGQISNADFNILDAVAPDRQLVAAFPSKPTEAISCYLQNCTFKVNCDRRFTSIQENILWNPKTGNIDIESMQSSGMPYRYTIDSNRAQEVSIPDTLCRSGSGVSSAEIIRVLLPSMVGDQGGLSASVSIEGMAHIEDSIAGKISCNFIRTQVTVAVGKDGEINVVVDPQFCGSTAGTSSSGGDPVTLVITANAVRGDGFVRVIATPGLAAPNVSSVSFAGTARLHWRSNYRGAPMLQIRS